MIVIVIIAALLLVIPINIMNGITLSFGWEWFLTPIIGLSQPGIVPCIGICNVVWFLTHQYKKSDDNDAKSILLSAYIRPFVYLFIMWVIHLFL